MAEEYDYFFVLYIIGFCAEGWLAVLALLHYPSDEHLEALPDDPDMLAYEVQCRSLELPDVYPSGPIPWPIAPSTAGHSGACLIVYRIEHSKCGPQR